MPVLPPPPVQDTPGSYAWLDWYRQLRNYISQTGSVPWSVIDFAGSNITSIASRSHQNLQALQGGTSGQYYHLTNADYTGTGTGVVVRKTNAVLVTPEIGVATGTSITLTDGIVLPKTTGKGIKVDTASPTWSWRIVPCPITYKGNGATDPTLTTYRTNIKGFQYAVSDESWLEIHIPMDYVPNTELYLEYHWSLATGGVSENVTWGCDATYAKGENQAAFPATVNLTQLTASSTTQYQLMNTELNITASGKLTIGDIEPGGLILARVYLSANSGATDPFLHMVNMAYQSKITGTKNRGIPYYT